MKCPKCNNSMKFEQVPSITGKHYARYRCTNPDCKHIFAPMKKGQGRTQKTLFSCNGGK